ncbi:MAG: prephenate dehydrogenase/arogenate dehydrogenase family protein [Deltaproteobacteria bacterium]|nr:prephenate dehydrogenase/arogenate dehydrogenase family protein [Deltaproteobacteria bacterium]
METERLFFENTVIIGVGLIGGSLAIELRDKGLVRNLIGVGRGIKNLESAKRLNVVDSFTLDIKEAVKDADLVVVAVPVEKSISVMKECLKFLKKGAIMTDVGSVKGRIVDEIGPLVPEHVDFIPGHPIAGTEFSGVESALKGLFKGRKCILTPFERTAKPALDKIRLMWEQAGSTVVMMDAERHDRILAGVSHLPHMIAYCLVNTVADMDEGQSEILGYSAGGFRDFTRITSSSPEMWAEVGSLNKDEIFAMLNAFEIRLKRLKTLISEGRFEELKKDFERAKTIRDSLNVKH